MDYTANIFIKKQSGFVAKDNKVIPLSDITGYRYPIALIAAIARNRAIGMNNQLPWRLPEDMAYFKRITLHKPVIMGRKTFESLGNKPLPERTNIILSRRETFHPDKRIDQRKLDAKQVLMNIQSSGFIIADTLEEAIQYAEMDLDVRFSANKTQTKSDSPQSTIAVNPKGVMGIIKNNPPPLSQELLKEGADRQEIMIIGGEQIYRQFFPLAARLYITQVDTVVEGDSFFPIISSESFGLYKEFSSYSEKANLEFKFQVLERKKVSFI